MTMQYESLIFDIDGTLWDSRARVAEGYNIQLRREGLGHLAVDAEDLRPLFGRVMTDIADVILATVPAPQRYEIMDRCMQTENEYLAECECDFGYPGVRETMAALSRNHRLFIVSNAQQGYPELCIRKLGLEPYIQGHMCFGDTGKPKGDTILALMAKHNIPSAVYIGDTQGDLEATERAGIPFIFAAYGFGDPQRWDQKIDSIRDLEALDGSFL